MLCRAGSLATVAIMTLVVSASCAGDLDRTATIWRKREGLVLSLSDLADDIDRNLTDVETRLADPAMRPEDVEQLGGAAALATATTRLPLARSASYSATTCSRRSANRCSPPKRSSTTSRHAWRCPRH
jgi:hypothetical protein